MMEMIMKKILMRGLSLKDPTLFRCSLLTLRTYLRTYLRTVGTVLLTCTVRSTPYCEEVLYCTAVQYSTVSYKVYSGTQVSYWISSILILAPRPVSLATHRPAFRHFSCTSPPPLVAGRLKA
jgi:hypothetical protein